MGTATLLWVWLGHHCPLAFQRWPSSGVVVMEWGWGACRPWCQQALSNSGLPNWGPWVGCWGSGAIPGVMSEIITVNLYFLQRGPRFSQRPGTLPRSHIHVMRAPFSQPGRGTGGGEEVASFLSPGKRLMKILAKSFINCELTLSPSTHRGLGLPLLLKQKAKSHWFHPSL